MIRITHILILLLASVVLIVSCGKDDPTGGAEDDLLGIWILQSANRGGAPIAVPADTLIYRGDFTGHYGAVANLDSYNLEYWVSHDTLFSFHTDGQTVGLTDSIRYEVDLDELIRFVRVHPDTVETQTWDRR
jgi:hypothetical protein